MGYRDITVLDISENAIERARIRLGDKGRNVKWIVSDITGYEPSEKYDFQHDRATFHFLTEENEVDKYLEIVEKCLQPGGYLVLGTFSDIGPDRCSGLDIRKYTEESMENLFSGFFKKGNCIIVDHVTPSGAVQNFIFCSFRRRPEN